jgi:hypothetical protein
MIGMDSDHCRTVTESLEGKRKVDDHTFAALAVLCERLERVKKLDDAFAGISFSPAVQKLENLRNRVAVS